MPTKTSGWTITTIQTITISLRATKIARQIIAATHPCTRAACSIITSTQPIIGATQSVTAPIQSTAKYFQSIDKFVPATKRTISVTPYTQVATTTDNPNHYNW